MTKKNKLHIKTTGGTYLGMLEDVHRSSLMSHGLQCRLNTTWEEHTRNCILTSDLMQTKNNMKRKHIKPKGNKYIGPC